MLNFHQQGGTRYRRTVALVAVYAFLLAGGLAFQHLDGSPGRHHRASHPGVPGVHSFDCSPSHHPEKCLACLWSRAAIGNSLSAKPAVVRTGSFQTVRCVGEVHYHSLLPVSYSSRAPPAFSL